MEIKNIDTHYLTRGRLEVRIIRVQSPLLFWVHLKNGEQALTDLLEELNFRLNRKSKDLFYWSHCLREGEAIAIKIKNFWQRGLILKINKQQSIAKIALKDWGIEIWRHLSQIYILEDQFRTLEWQAVKCGLAYTKPSTQVTQWPERTNALVKFLAKNQEGWIKIMQSLDNGAALVKLIIYNEHTEGANNLRDILIQLGHAQLCNLIKMDISPTV